MAKGKNQDLMPTLGSVLALFAVFLQCLDVLHTAVWRMKLLLAPALWLFLGLCLLTRRKNWLLVLGLLPLASVRVQNAWMPLPMNSVYLFVNVLLCEVFPAVAFAVLLFFAVLSCLCVGGKLRRELWFLPILLMLPLCIWQYEAALPWVQLGIIACVGLWLKPGGK